MLPQYSEIDMQVFQTPVHIQVFFIFGMRDLILK